MSVRPSGFYSFGDVVAVVGQLLRSFPVSWQKKLPEGEIATESVDEATSLCKHTLIWGLLACPTWLRTDGRTA